MAYVLSMLMFLYIQYKALAHNSVVSCCECAQKTQVCIGELILLYLLCEAHANDPALIVNILRKCMHLTEN